MSDEEPDQESGAPHPRRTQLLFGHGRAEHILAAAIDSGRPHHAWLLCGPKGIGKATLAYRAARVLLGARRRGGQPLAVDPADPVSLKIAALSHPDLHVLRRGLNERGKPKRDISVDEAREVARFLSMQPAEGGWRVVIIDAADELNRNAANAILKTLEEPPERALALLVCHAPGMVLPTIRSRCRRLDLLALEEDHLTQAVEAACGRPPSQLEMDLAQGSAGRAVQLLSQGAAQLREELTAALEGVLNGRKEAFAALAQPASPDRVSLVCEQAQLLLRGIAVPRTPGERALSESFRLRAPLEGWANAWFELSRLEERATSLGLDPTATIVRIGWVLDQHLRQRQAS